MAKEQYEGTIKSSQENMKDLFYGFFKHADKMLKENKSEEVSDIIVSLYQKKVYDCVEVKIDTDVQTSFFTIAQAVNSISSFWYFLENIVNGADISYWYQDQEGPDAGIIARKVNEDYIRVSVLENGWWEFYKGKKGLRKISYDKPVITLDITCLKQEFIKKIYAMLKSIKYHKPEVFDDGTVDWDPWKDEPRDNKAIKKYVKEHTLSIKHAFGCGAWSYDEMEVFEPQYINEVLDSIYKKNNDLLQIAVLYKYGSTKVCHTMVIPEIVWIRKELLEPIKNNKPARYFDDHCSCDFEFTTSIVNEKYIRLVITDKNDEPYCARFDQIISKDEFLLAMDKALNEICVAVDKLIDNYAIKNGLLDEQQQELRTRLYEWQ